MSIFGIFMFSNLLTTILTLLILLWHPWTTFRNKYGCQDGRQIHKITFTVYKNNTMFYSWLFFARRGIVKYKLYIWLMPRWYSWVNSWNQDDIQDGRQKFQPSYIPMDTCLNMIKIHLCVLIRSRKHKSTSKDKKIIKYIA